MSKLIKKIKKIEKHPKLCIYLGQEHSDLPELLTFIPTIFRYKHTKLTVSGKNLIYVNDLKFLTSLNEINIIFVNDLEKQLVLEIQSILIKSSPIIFLRCQHQISTEQSNFFKNIRYHAVDYVDNYQIWKSQWQK
jgi:hypothetical protein